MTTTQDLAVTVCVASFNTRSCTELCVRSIHDRAGYPLTLRVGDSGSTDGSVELLEAMQARRLLTLEPSGSARLHAEWLDYWRSHVDADLLVFVDSDVEFRRRDWLVKIVAEVQRSGCTIIYAEWLPGGPTCLDNRSARLAGRPAPWLLGLVPGELTAVEASFAEVWTETSDVPEGLLVEDVGAAFSAESSRGGAHRTKLPKSFGRHYHHYGGLSWIPSGGWRGRKKDRDESVVSRRLRLLRIAQESKVRTRRRLARVLLSPSVEDVREFAFRASAKIARTRGTYDD